MVSVVLVGGWWKLTGSPAVGIVHVGSVVAIVFKRNLQKKT